MVFNAPSYAALLMGEGWQRVPGNVTIVTETGDATPDSVVVTETPPHPEGSRAPKPAAMKPVKPVGRPRKG